MNDGLLVEGIGVVKVVLCMQHSVQGLSLDTCLELAPPG